MIKSRKIVFAAISISLSLLFGIAVLEIGLRLVSFSSGTGTGKAAQRWFQENWKPVNALGYRDTEIDASGNKPRIVFLGDSFTAGQGVKFDATFYYLTRERLDAARSFANISNLGASTLDETSNFDGFIQKHKGRIEAVVHQYLVNDIDDYTRNNGGPRYERSELRSLLIKFSELANLIDNYFYIRSVGREYMDSLFSAYADPSILERHLNDLRALHAKIHASGTKIIFVVFPFLNNSDIIAKSVPPLERVKQFFHSNCERGDVMLDVQPIASSFTDSERVVNPLDPHPSKVLHVKIAEKLIGIFSDEGQEDRDVEHCGSKGRFSSSTPSRPNGATRSLEPAHETAGE